MDLKELQSKDVQAIIGVLKEMGVEDYEPRVVNQLIEFSYRYITTILEDARAFSNHAGKKTIDADDIKVAIKSKVDYSFTTTPPRELLMEISKNKNKNPLPPIRYQGGIRLPPDRFCLHGTNYVFKTQQQPKPVAKPQTQAAKPIAKHTAFVSDTNESSAALHQFQAMAIKRRRNDEDDYDA